MRLTSYNLLSAWFHGFHIAKCFCSLTNGGRFVLHVTYLFCFCYLCSFYFGGAFNRRQAYFIYNHPLFSSPATNFNMLRKIFSIKRGGYDNFNTYVRLQSMDKWHKSIHKGDLLWNDFKKQKDLYESGPTYLLDFHVNVVKHHKDNVSELLRK